MQAHAAPTTGGAGASAKKGKNQKRKESSAKAKSKPKGGTKKSTSVMIEEYEGGGEGGARDSDRGLSGGGSGSFGSFRRQLSGNSGTPLQRMRSGDHTSLDSALTLLASVGVPVADSW
jgi:hypothetical protein